MKSNEEIIKKLAKKYDLPVYVVKAACNSPFSFLKTVIERGDFESVQIPYLGKFLVPPHVFKKYLEQSNGYLRSGKKQNEEQGESESGREA